MSVKFLPERFAALIIDWESKEECKKRSKEPSVRLHNAG